MKKRLTAGAPWTAPSWPAASPAPSPEPPAWPSCRSGSPDLVGTRQRNASNNTWISIRRRDAAWSSRALTDGAGLQLRLHGVVVGGELLVDVGLHHVVLRETANADQAKAFLLWQTDTNFRASVGRRG